MIILKRPLIFNSNYDIFLTNPLKYIAFKVYKDLKPFFRFSERLLETPYTCKTNVAYFYNYENL